MFGEALGQGATTRLLPLHQGLSALSSQLGGRDIRAQVWSPETHPLLWKASFLQQEFQGPLPTTRTEALFSQIQHKEDPCSVPPWDPNVSWSIGLAGSLSYLP